MVVSVRIGVYFTCAMCHHSYVIYTYRLPFKVVIALIFCLQSYAHNVHAHQLEKLLPRFSLDIHQYWELLQRSSSLVFQAVKPFLVGLPLGAEPEPWAVQFGAGERCYGYVTGRAPAPPPFPFCSVSVQMMNIR